MDDDLSQMRANLQAAINDSLAFLMQKAGTVQTPNIILLSKLGVIFMVHPNFSWTELRWINWMYNSIMNCDNLTHLKEIGTHIESEMNQKFMLDLTDSEYQGFDYD